MTKPSPEANAPHADCGCRACRRKRADRRYADRLLARYEAGRMNPRALARIRAHYFDSLGGNEGYAEAERAGMALY